MDALTERKGLTTGAAAQFEFRSFINSHKDTCVVGPMTAEELVKEAERRD